MFNLIISSMAEAVPPTTQDIQLAYVKVDSGGLANEWAYLVSDPFLQLPGIIIDSTRVDNQGSFSFHFTPSPNSSYEIRSVNFFANKLGFAPGDSIILGLNHDQEQPKCKYDRIGAITSQFKIEGERDESALQVLFEDTSCIAYSHFQVALKRRSRILSFAGRYVQK